MIKRTIPFVFLLFILSCGSNKSPEDNKDVVNDMSNSQPPDGHNEENITESLVIDKETMERGKNVYETYCLMCHQTNGSGVPSTFPPLTETKHVLGPKENLIKIILNGQKGEIEVLGEIYDGEMPAQDFLTNRQVSDVLTFVRNSFGNNASPISPEEVQEVRSK